jgi:hypothetical protein
LSAMRAPYLLCIAVELSTTDTPKYPREPNRSPNQLGY